MSNKKIICFVTDAGSKKFLGFGHLFRCINIANYLKKKNYNVFFKTKSNISKKIISKYKFKQANANQINQSEFIFVDVPRIKYSELKRYNEKKIIIIDEFNNFKGKHKKYKIFKSKNYNKILYFKLSFLLNQKKIIKVNNNKLKFLISFGGNDYYNYSKKIYKFLLKQNVNDFKFIKKINGINNFASEIILKNYNKIFETYKIECYIGSGGNTMFEMLMRNIPCLIIPTNKIEKYYTLKLRKEYKIDLLNFNTQLNVQFNKIKKKKKLSINKKNLIKFYNKLFL
jgi:spore coat polysaccharide biosynthesis predicted glycosyltransferase SpsG